MSYLQKTYLAEQDYNFIVDTIKKYYRVGFRDANYDITGTNNVNNHIDKIESDLKCRFLNK